MRLDNNIQSPLLQYIWQGENMEWERKVEGNRWRERSNFLFGKKDDRREVRDGGRWSPSSSTKINSKSGNKRWKIYIRNEMTEFPFKKFINRIVILMDKIVNNMKEIYYLLHLLYSSCFQMNLSLLFTLSPFCQT